MGKVSNPYNFNPKDDYRSYSEINKKEIIASLVDIPFALFLNDKYRELVKTKRTTEILANGTTVLNDRNWYCSNGSGTYDAQLNSFDYGNPFNSNTNSLDIFHLSNTDYNSKGMNYYSYMGFYDNDIERKNYPIEIPVLQAYNEYYAFGKYNARDRFDYIIYKLNNNHLTPTIINNDNDEFVGKATYCHYINQDFFSWEFIHSDSQADLRVRDAAALVEGQDSLCCIGMMYSGSSAKIFITYPGQQANAMFLQCKLIGIDDSSTNKIIVYESVMDGDSINFTTENSKYLNSLGVTFSFNNINTYLTSRITNDIVDGNSSNPIKLFFEVQTAFND